MNPYPIHAGEGGGYNVYWERRFSLIKRISFKNAVTIFSPNEALNTKYIDLRKEEFLATEPPILSSFLLLLFLGISRFHLIEEEKANERSVGFTSKLGVVLIPLKI